MFAAESYDQKNGCLFILFQKGELDVCKKLAGDKRDAEEEKATTLLNLRILENAARPNTRVMSSKKSHLIKHNVTHLPKNCIHLCG